MTKLRLSLEDGELLVRLARKAIVEWLKSRVKINPPENVDEKLKVNAGVFVTLNRWDKGRSLRGCIGIPYPVKPLIEAVIEAAIDAATGDPRFPPVKLDEMRSIVVEVSVLTPPVEVRVEDPMDYPRRIEIGVDGLIVEKGPFKGLLLPQVAVEWNMDPEEFLSNCCMKAGLPPDSWISKDVKIWKFQASVFAEEEPEGSVRWAMHPGSRV
ncbi:MAG: TIGR00296 family protein [Candidatus Bathyarchaeia archaeon]|nr:TIGR00296 family protein [Candidatus Bathyarchaeota archaeon]